MMSLSNIWAELERETIPSDIPDKDRELCRYCFYATAVLILGAMAKELEGSGLSLADSRAVEMLRSFLVDLNQFAREVVSERGRD